MVKTTMMFHCYSIFPQQKKTAYSPQSPFLLPLYCQFKNRGGVSRNISAWKKVLQKKTFEYSSSEEM